MPRRAPVSVGLVLLAAALGPRAHADEADYRPENEGWNGLSTLFQIARAQGVQPDMRATIDWEELGPSDAVVILYPRVEPDLARLRAYLERGGRLLLADDFGAAAPTFLAFGLRRVPPPPAPRFQGREALPVATAASDHPLGRGVGTLVGNHASALLGPGQPVLVFAPGESLCIDVPVGRGHLVALGDPSVLINNMLELPAHQAFARNLVGWLSRPGGRLVVVTQEYSERGFARAEPTGHLGAGSLHDFNDFLRDLRTWIPVEGALRVLALGATLAVALLIFLGLPTAPPEDGGWVAPYGPPGPPPLAQVLAALAREDLDARLAAVPPLPPRGALARRLARLRQRLETARLRPRRARALAARAHALLQIAEREP